MGCLWVYIFITGGARDLRGGVASCESFSFSFSKTQADIVLHISCYATKHYLSLRTVLTSANANHSQHLTRDGWPRSVCVIAP